MPINLYLSIPNKNLFIKKFSTSTPPCKDHESIEGREEEAIEYMEEADEVFLKGQYERSIEAYKKALEFSESQVGKHHILSYQILNGLTKAQFANDNIDDAIETATGTINLIIEAQDK